ncbi:hypothetical protein Q9R32_10020 [Actinotalea sp. AC32]|nr:hypothetical protein [Actinotalea sp. AC32]
MIIAAVVACLLLTALVAFQVALAAGAPWGHLAWGGQNEGLLPGRLRVGSAVSVLLYALFAVVALDRAGLVDVLPDGFTAVACWVLTGYLTLGVLMNLASRSRAERLVMTPVAAALALCFLVLALG